MSDGVTHDRAILLTIPIIALGTYTIAPDYTFLAIAGHVFGGLFLSPDLDLPSRPWNRWGWLKVLWIPYQKMSKHRGLSHAPFLGMIIRLLYLLLPILLVVLYRGKINQLISQFLVVDWKAIALLWLGLEFSVWVHLACDRILFKRLKK